LGQNIFHARDILNSKNIPRNVQGFNSSFCRDWFENLEILNTPSVYIYCLTLLVVDNTHYVQTNCSSHHINTWFVPKVSVLIFYVNVYGIHLKLQVIPFKVRPLGRYTVFPTFFPLIIAVQEVIFYKCV
jgi:hypothetical protein